MIVTEKKRVGNERVGDRESMENRKIIGGREAKVENG